MEKENYKVGDYIYIKCRTFNVGKITKIENGIYNKLWCYWSKEIRELPKTINEFNKLKFESFAQFDCDNDVHKLNLIDDISTAKPKKYTIEHIINGNKTIVVVHNPDGTYSKGIAKCSPEDEFNKYEGFILAYSRAIGKKTTINKNVSECTNEELVDELNRRLNK